MVSKAIGIKNNKTGGTLLYITELHTFTESDVAQEEYIKEYEVNLDDEISGNALRIAYDNLEDEALNMVPDIGYVVINNECNMDCTFCYANKNSVESKGKFDIKWLEHLKTILPEKSFSHPIISGGEPFLEFELLKKIRPFFKNMTINTNGSLINSEIAEWVIETKTDLYIALDFKIEDFDGHDAKIKEHVANIVDKHPGIKNLIQVAVTYPSDKVGELESIRADQFNSFEKGLKHEFNFVDGKKESLESDFESEVKRIESGELGLEESIFGRQVKYITKVIKNYINIESCSPAVHINFKGDVHLCQVRASSIDRHNYEQDVICNIDEFDLDKYFEKTQNTKKRGVCKDDCNCKWFCGNICWANINNNKHNCDINKKALFYTLYLVANYSDIDLTQVVNIANRLTLQTPGELQ